MKSCKVGKQCHMVGGSEDYLSHFLGQSLWSLVFTTKDEVLLSFIFLNQPVGIFRITMFNPRDPFSWHICSCFLPKWFAGNVKLIKMRYFLNHSVRRHLNDHKKWLIFSASSRPPGGPKMVENLECSRFLYFVSFWPFW